MNTGLRRGELLALRWECIDFKGRTLAVEGGTAKNRQTRHIPLNDSAIGLLNHWREETTGGRRIFEVKTGFKTAWAKLLIRAHITKFRWHDLRHSSGSRIIPAPARGPAQYRPGSSGSQLGGNVIAIRPLGARPTA